MNPNDPDRTIHITREEALSDHVEDMLKRQMSLRGDPGVTRDRQRNWFYQNWFVFAIVGALGAFVAWAILEPFFDDLLYFQGVITATSQPQNQSERNASDDDDFESPQHIISTITIRDEKIILTPSTKEILADGSYVRARPGDLKEGETVGVYVEFLHRRERSLAIAGFVVHSPPAQPPAQAKLSLEQLKSRQTAVGMLLFPLVAGLIGLFVGAADGMVCRLPRRALLCGLVGLIVGFVGGFICSLVANIVYAPLTELAAKQGGDSESALSTLGFVIQVGGRSFAWCLAGMAMGLGQGIALRSKRLLLYGLLGGIVGGLLGGLLFDPIDLILLGPDKPSAHWSRLVGFVVIGLSVGGMIGLVELLARDAWLRMTQGPLAGKEFLIFKDVMNVGASPRSDIYLFNDPLVAGQHAILRAQGEECEVETCQSSHPVLLNNRPITRARLRHGDNVTIGRTAFVFQQRKS